MFVADSPRLTSARVPGPQPGRLAGISRAYGLALATLALLAQVVAAVAMPLPTVDVGFDGSFPICHAGAADDAGTPAPAVPHRHGMDCAVCPLCTALAAAVLPTPEVPGMAAPGGMVVVPVAWPPSHAPPALAIRAATFPTGPPRLS